MLKWETSVIVIKQHNGNLIITIFHNKRFQGHYHNAIIN